ncbi:MULTISPECIES: DNA-methyltransferase [Bacillus]|nr:MULTISPECIES: site-specific DNA-methyltransferase [Bacillus]MCA1213015.1 site-specific DNA-methyltransferase [Bacillus amyloliquefaciens]MCC8301559.1 site-specific DNA-methyltransferase [Bacillus sp. AF12]MCR4364987.1 site-specific DNA-methyltransferase [Bacillus amyloliquefaciens]MCV3198565.1 site-specific DNA-methyltransferase [Bacillus velezensis]MDP1502205.1 site-specific DNA-methyltransferase [Bacillus velezensis]
MFTNKFFKALDIRNQKELLSFSKTTGIPVSKLKMYNEESILPFNEDLKKIVKEIDITEIELKLKLGILDSSTIDLLAKYSSEINTIIKNSHLTRENSKKNDKSPVFQTDFGLLYQDDCLSLMENIPKNSVDLIFADPPFNLNKKYESKINDQLSKAEYLKWTETWVLNCIELLKEGGSFFVWNLPVWNTHISSILNKYLNFRQWIAVDIKYQLPIPNKLYPAHYSLLYYTKGKKPNTFNNQRLPMEICRHCGGDIKDYGGYKNKLNKNGLNLSDVWHDLSPVRHGKYKSRESNELPIKLLERVISMASNEGDLIFDPFGGSGTTFIVSEILKRRWIGCEIGPVDSIIKRFDDVDLHKKQISEIQKKKNVLFTEEMRNIRSKNEHWLPETINGK